VPRIRLFEPEPDDYSTPIDWRFAALTMATLFLNFSFCFVHGSDVWMFCPLPLYAGLLAVGALLITAFFFLGPALATQAAKRPLFTVAKNSLGAIPAFGIRLCCILFVALWIANLLSVPGLFLRFILRRNVFSTESGLVAAVVLVFLFITGLQSLRTSAKLALFTNKLSIAVLIAALIRVHHGWAAALKLVPILGERSVVLDLWHGLSLLSFYVAPLALLAADFGYRVHGRKELVKTALIGISLPLAGTLLLVGVISVATLHSRFYTPSLNPNVAMALWSRAARSSLPGVMTVATITTFGAVRFGARALAESVSIRSYGSRVRWVLLGFLIGAHRVGFRPTRQPNTLSRFRNVGYVPRGRRHCDYGRHSDRQAAGRTKAENRLDRRGRPTGRVSHALVYAAIDRCSPGIMVAPMAAAIMRNGVLGLPS
jgi:hypothetical protein